MDDMRELVTVIVEEYNKSHNASFDVDELFSFEYNSQLQYVEAKPRHTTAKVMPVILFVKNAMSRIERYVDGVDTNA